MGRVSNEQMALNSLKAWEAQVSQGTGSSEKHASDIFGGKKNMPQGEYVQIETSDLEPFRSKGVEDFSPWDESDFEELVLSIAQYGIMQPLVVRPIGKEESRFEILAGEHRWKAAQKLELRYVPCRVYRCDDATARSVFAFTNLITRDLTLRDKITWGSRYFELTRGKRQEVIQDLKNHGLLVGTQAEGISKKQLSRYFTISTLPDFLCELVKQEVISIATGLEFAQWDEEEYDLLEEFSGKIQSNAMAKRILKLYHGEFEAYDFNHEGLRYVTDNRRVFMGAPTTFNDVLHHAKLILKERIKKEEYQNAPDILNQALDLYAHFGTDSDLLEKVLEECRETQRNVFP